MWPESRAKASTHICTYTHKIYSQKYATLSVTELFSRIIIFYSKYLHGVNDRSEYDQWY